MTRFKAETTDDGIRIFDGIIIAAEFEGEDAEDEAREWIEQTVRTLEEERELLLD